MSKHKSNYQDLLKLFALIVMTIDHLGLYFYPDNITLRIIGRMAMPIFCFCAGYNFHNRPRHIIALYAVLLFALSIVVFRRIEPINILFTIYFGQWYIFFFETQLKKFNTSYWHVIMLSMMFLITNFLFEYGTVAIAIMILGYVAKHERQSINIVSMVSVSLSLMTSFLIFEPQSNSIILLLVESILLYLLLTAKNFTALIPFNINIISRNLLFLYFFEVALIQVLWSYFYAKY